MNANRGMYAEELVNRTNSYYYDKDIALIEKRYLPIKIVKNINETTIVGKLLAKSYVDYCGVYKGKHIEFEVKQTNEANFSLALIKEHQLRHLINAARHGAIPFVIIYFDKYDKFYLLSINDILAWKDTNTSKTIKYEYICQHGTELEITYPGIIDYLKVIK